MKKRVLSLMLAFLFVFALTAPASAIIDVYGDVSIIFPVPKEGRDFPSASSVVTTRGTATSLEWYHYNWAPLNPGEKVLGDGYQYVLTITLDEGYDWKWNSTLGEPDVALTFTRSDGLSITPTNVGGGDGKLVISGYIEAEKKKPEMDYVEITPLGDWKPVAGGKPDFKNYLVTNGGASYDVRWYDATTSEELTASSTFKAGHKYKIVFYILPDPFAQWKEASEGKAEVNAVFIADDGNIIATNPQLSYETTGTKLVVSYTFDCAEPPAALKTVSAVLIEPKNGMWYPVHGQKPVDQEHFKILTEGCAYLYVSWHDDTADKFLTASDKFVGGRAYTLYFSIFLSPGYAWADADKIQVMLEDGSGGGWTAKKPVVLSLTDYGMQASARFTFEAAKEELPEKLVIKNIHAPVEGKPLDFTVEVIGCSQYEVTWLASDMPLGWTEEDAPIAEKGEIYSINIRIWPPAGSEWPFREDEYHNQWLDLPYEMILSDGTKIEDAKAIYGGNDGVHPADACRIFCSFPPVGQDKPNKPQVSFMEEPEDLTVAEGQSAVFSVTILGERKSIQWYEAKPGGAFLKLTDGADVSGSTAETLTLKNVKTHMNGYSYRCVVTDKYDLEITSRTAVLSVKKAGEPAIVFKDVKEGDWFYDWVYGAVELGLINGKGKDKDGRDFFDPAGNITFAETAKLAACMHQLYTTGSVTLVNGDPWYRSYVDYCGENSILPTYVTGDGVITTGDILAKPNTAVTRAEFAWIFAHALPKEALPGINTIPDDSIPDVQHSGLAKEFWSFREQAYYEIYTLYRAGILNGSDAKGTFNPTSTIKRSEVAAIVVRMMEPAKRVGPPKELAQ